jgi:hypothetical protein
MSNPSKPQVLIIGCGAVGLVQGYHLSAGADITYLVRPGRKPAFLGPKHLYSYKDNELYIFSNYRLVESLSEIAEESFAFVLDTLDGNAVRSEAGIATSKAVGELLNKKQNADCFVIYSAIGLDTDRHYTRTMSIATTRLLLAVSMLAHQPNSRITVPETANKDMVAKADILFAYRPPKIGYLTFNTQPQLVAKFEAIYSANGSLGIQRIPAFVAALLTPVSMLHLVTWNVDGFGPFAHLRGNHDLWSLMLRAQSEILALPRYGWKGWFMSFVLKGWAVEKLNTPLVEGAKPMKFEEFNMFHHGGKVMKQDIRTLEDILREGERAGKEMPALKEIIRRAQETDRERNSRG